MWDKCAQYLRKMGGMILVASLVVWFLSYYPRTEHLPAGSLDHYENSYLGRMGRACEPAFRPLGLDWKAGVALLSGVPAKEIVVSTLGVLYSADGAAATGAETDADAEATSAPAPHDGSEGSGLAARLAASGDFTPASALAFLVFILLYFPCIATVMAIGSEAGWRWAAAAVVYDTLLAWLAAWGVYHLALWL